MLLEVPCLRRALSLDVGVNAFGVFGVICVCCRCYVHFEIHVRLGNTDVCTWNLLEVLMVDILVRLHRRTWGQHGIGCLS